MSVTAPGWRVRAKQLHEPLYRSLFRSAVFLASLVLLCESMLAPIEMSARVVVGQLAAQSEALSTADVAKPTLAVLKIDPRTFREEFKSTQPLNRCVLREHILELLKVRPNLKQLALDIDLSETGDPTLECCTTQIIDSLRDWEAVGLHSTLIIPVDKLDRKSSRKWRLRVDEAGLAMADPRVVREFGVVRRHWLNPDRCPTLGQAFALSPPDKVSLRTCFDPKLDLAELDAQRHATERNIAYHALVRGAWVPSVNDDGELQRLSEQIEALRNQPQIERVILGAQFDASDDHLTPIGPLAGVEIHAAVALQPDEPIFHALGFAFDIGFGMLFGYLAHLVWGQYFKQLLGSRNKPPTASGQQLAYLWPTFLLIGWAALVFLALPLLSLLVLQLFKTWINPAPMLMGMTIDAFVLGSVASAVHHAGHAIKAVPDPAPVGWRDHARCLLTWLPTFVWWTVVALAAAKLVFHVTPFDLLPDLTVHGDGE